VIAILVLASLALGCGGPSRPIFPEPPIDLVWPPPPQPARVRWVGELRSSEDVVTGGGFFESVREIFTGRSEPEVLYGPRAVLTTEGGSVVWIADVGGRCLHRYGLEGRDYRKVTRAGETPLLGPVDLCVGPDGSMFVCDSEGAAIYRLSTEDGALLDALPLPEEIGRPVAVSFRPATGDLFVLDIGSHDVKVLGPDGSLRRIFGRRGEEPGEFNFPTDLLDDGIGLWIVDAGNHRVQGLSYEGVPTVAIGQVGDAPGDLALPKSVAVDSDGHLYVVDARFENIQIFDRDGRLLLFLGEEGIGPGQFWLPSGIHIDGQDRIWVCDSYNGRVQVFAYLSRESSPQ